MSQELPSHDSRLSESDGGRTREVWRAPGVISRAAAFARRYGFAVLCSVYLFTLGILKERNRGLLTIITEHFGFHVGPSIDAASTRGLGLIPLVRPGDLMRGETLFQIRYPLAAAGMPSIFELMVINQLIQQHRPGKLFEIGTFDGRTTLNMACNAPPEAKVYTLDLPTELQRERYWALFPNHDKKLESQDDMLGSRYRGTEYEDKILQLYGDSATFDFTPFLNDIDFVFIDGSHEYETVLSDSRTALKLLRGGKGIVLWHNYDAADFPEAVRAMDECYLKVKGFEGLRHIEGTTLVVLPTK